MKSNNNKKKKRGFIIMIMTVSFQTKLMVSVVQSRYLTIYNEE